MMFDFDEYKRLGEPGKIEKSGNWQTAIGLQQVDGLKPSAYLIETARKNIEGDITFEEVKERLRSYYIARPVKTGEDDRTEEADKVSAHMAEILSEKAFSFGPVEFISIHRRLFDEVYHFAGKIRDYNISKAEWVLGGETVNYANAVNIRATLDYDFAQEKKFDYQWLTKKQTVEHIAKFVSSVWQIHAFGEGNTRTVAVFAIKYLGRFGFAVNNDLFKEHSWYFRNALVRANYDNYPKGIHANPEFLYRFFGNLLLGESNILKNRELHVDYKNYTVSIKNDTVNDTVNGQDATVKGDNASVNAPIKIKKASVSIENAPVSDTANGKNDTVSNKSGTACDTVNIKNDAVNDTVFNMVMKEPHVTAAKIAEQSGLGIATVKRHIKKLKDSGKIERVGSDKTGYWKVKGRIG